MRVNKKERMRERKSPVNEEECKEIGESRFREVNAEMNKKDRKRKAKKTP